MALKKLGSAKLTDQVLLTSVNAATEVTGILGVANGGTGQSVFTNGQLLIGNTTGNTLTKATLTAGSGISITNGNGSITIANTVTSIDANNLTGTTLASNVVNSSLTSVGTLTGLTVSGASPSFNTVNSTGTLTLGTTAAVTQEQRFRLTNSVVTGGVELVLNGAGTSWGLYDRTAAKWAIQVTRGTTDSVSIPGYAAVGGGASSNAQFYVRGTLVGSGTNQYGALVQTTFPVAATSGMLGIYVSTTGAAGTYTTASVVGVQVASHTLGAGQTVNNAYGAIIDTSSFATTNSKYGISIGSVTGGASGNFAIYTNAGQVRLGDDLRIISGSLSLTTIPSKSAVAIQVNNDHAQLTSATSYGMLMQPTAQGTVTNYRAIEARVVISATTALTSAYGAYIRTPTITAGGTIATNYGLHVEAQTGATTNYAIYTNAGLVRFGDAVLGANGTASAPAYSNNADTNTGTFFPAADTLAFATGGSERVRIDSSGNVGIGTTSPLGQLDVPWSGTPGKPTILLGATDGGSTRTDATQKNFRIGAYHYTNASTPYAVLMGNSDASNNEVRIGGGTGLLNAATTIVMYTGATTTTATGTARLLINSSGNVGIGTTSPSYKLHVAGDIYATGNVTAYSDARVKENVATIDGALAKVLALRGVYYDRVDDPSKTRRLGVIAQEVLKVAPEVVSYAKDIDQYSVAYGNIVGLLIEAIKELAAEVRK